MLVPNGANACGLLIAQYCRFVQEHDLTELPSDMKWKDVGLIGGVSFVLSVLATIYPAWRAVKVQPAECPHGSYLMAGIVIFFPT